MQNPIFSSNLTGSSSKPFLLSVVPKNYIDYNIIPLKYIQLTDSNYQF